MHRQFSRPAGSHFRSNNTECRWNERTSTVILWKFWFRSESNLTLHFASKTNGLEEIREPTEHRWGHFDARFFFWVQGCFLHQDFQGLGLTCTHTVAVRGRERSCTWLRLNEARMLQRMGGSKAMRHGFDIQDTLFFESWSSSRVCDTEELSSESSRKMHEETTSEASWTAVTKGKGKEVWRREPEGEAENPEVTHSFVERGGRRHRESGRWQPPRANTSKNHEKGKRRSSPNGKKGWSKGARWRGWGDSKSKKESDSGRIGKKRRIMWNNHWTWAKKLVSCQARSASRKAHVLGWQNRCSDKALSFWQFVSVVVEEGEESNTANLCQQCYNKHLMVKGEAPLTKWQWYAVVETKAHIVAGCGECWGKTSTYKKSGSAFVWKTEFEEIYERRPRRKSRKRCKANGNMSLWQKNTLNK